MIARFQRGARSATSLRALLATNDRIDLDGIAAALGVQANTRSFVYGIERVVSSPLSTTDPRSIETILGDLLAAVPDAAYALGGGVDAALLLALARRRGLRAIAYTLRPRLRADRPLGDPDRYDEHEAATEIARALGVELRIVEADDEAFAAALPGALAAMETPLYNLHPVSRYLLAKRIAADGYSTIITGDGADQRCAGSASADYLPIVAALTQAAGLALVCPYLAPSMRALEGDADKHALRELLARDLPTLAAKPKRGKLAPAIEISIDESRIAALAEMLGPARLPCADRARVGLATSVLLADQLGVH